ncbi:hypothetical protein NMN56_036680 [Streptomyces iconiensis]|uniref:Neocarzinostatin family protein n=1 Tax=Streptomyces iconiensis TaxID=1384038 RepID=A0ABT7A8S8_9ACTN|nr:hypothetical protein [Streptomyces iconiensis]MDJ1137394.1 hypothetical protein [Streptomyces iconiensis]
MAASAAAPAAALAVARPTITLSKGEAGTGGSVTVRGKGWRSDTLLTLLVCGQNAIGGTNACANAEGRAVTTGKDGTFTKKIPVTEPPKPCPCVVRATTVTGAHASADAKFQVAGHPVKPLPKERTGGRLSVLAARLEGDSGLLNWFGAPEQRQLVLTVGNLGADRAKDPVFEIGTAHGVLAPEWERQQWRGTVDPGKKAQVKLPVELSSGAHGDYTVAAKYGEKVLTEQPWDVGRPWGVTLFWILLFAVVPLAVFRLGMAVVERARPRSPGEIVSDRRAWKERLRSRLPQQQVREPSHAARRRARPPAASPAPAPAPPSETTSTLPWFTPDTTLTPRPGPGPGPVDGPP